MTSAQLISHSVVKAQSFYFKIGNKTYMPSLPTFIQCSIRSLSIASRQEKETKYIQSKKEDVILLLFPDDMILYIENPKDTTKKLKTAGVQPRWIQGDSKVGRESASLEKYIFNHRYRKIRNG